MPFDRLPQISLRFSGFDYATYEFSHQVRDVKRQFTPGIDPCFEEGKRTTYGIPEWNLRLYIYQAEVRSNVFPKDNINITNNVNCSIKYHDESDLTFSNKWW